MSRLYRSWELVFDSDLLWLGRLLILLVDDGDLETKLELGLGRTVELLVDGSVVWVEGYEIRGTVGVTLKDGLGGGRDGEQEPQLEPSTEISNDSLDGRMLSRIR